MGETINGGLSVRLDVCRGIADRVDVRLACRRRGRLRSAPPIRCPAEDAAGLRAVLLAADAFFLPDAKASTAGIHVAKVLGQLDIAGAVASRVRIYPSGATAMRHLAESSDRRPIGCTQSTEIISTKDVVLSGTLPPGSGSRPCIRLLLRHRPPLHRMHSA